MDRNANNNKNVGFYNQLVDRLILEQTGNGEFGLSRKQEVVNTVSPYHKSNQLGKKANSFITMYAIELLFQINPSSPQVRNALNWFYGRISQEGYFTSDTTMSAEIEDLVSGKVITTKNTIKIFRHTASALASILLVDGANDISVKLIDNILSIQNHDGGWGATSLTQQQSELLTTAFTLKALTVRDVDYILDNGYSRIERTKKKLEIENAINRAINWFMEQSFNLSGLWYSDDVGEKNKAFYTGIILGMNSAIFGKQQYQDFTSRLISQLCTQSNNGVWLKDGVIDIDGSSRVLAALIKLRKYIDFNFDLLASRISLRNSIIDNSKGIDNLDPATLCFLVDIFSVDRDYDRQNKIVNVIVAILDNNKKVLGTGFILHNNNNKTLCITCRHLFKSNNQQPLYIKLDNGDVLNAKIIAGTEEQPNANSIANNDIAVLEIESNLNFVQSIKNNPETTQTYSLFGYGFSTNSRGKWIGNLKYIGAVGDGYVQYGTEEIVENGFSGSPIINSNQEIMGMAQSRKDRTLYVIPINTINNFLKKGDL